MNAMILLGVLAVIGLAIAAIPGFVRARNRPAGTSCVHNLRCLYGATEQWALENHRSTNDILRGRLSAPIFPRAFRFPNALTAESTRLEPKSIRPDAVILAMCYQLSHECNGRNFYYRSRLFQTTATKYQGENVTWQSAFPMINFRPSTPEDAAEIAACVDAVSRERRFLGNVVGFTADQTRSFLTSLAEAGGVQMIVLDERAVVGWCDVTIFPFEGMRHAGRLGMGILPAYRGQGLGRRLLRDVLRRIFARGLLRVELEVFASNVPAIRLYECEGFVMEGRKRQARILDNVQDDILVMGLLRKEWRFAGE